MKIKNLIPYTIVPQALYVPREADRQLEEIVASMGRPGYVLVARQMGKTNLLLNMKRQLEAGRGIPFYFDLSRRPETAVAFFRNIIDTMIEVRPDLYSEAAERIHGERLAGSNDPNLEFDRHLRLLLSSSTEKVVIILDEVDALVSAAYSDKVFAQIRSMYFSRTTFPVYERLTYVLSGVAEPGDLIKDKALSPFNIGQKIYLNDFTKHEAALFLKMAGLKTSAKVFDSIYGWTSGNPRTMWDVCSELEDLMLAGSEASVGHVDSAIHKLYLTNFDRAPIDHIRTLVSEDPEIRDAVVSLKYGKGSALDSKIRSRLYLAGIIGADSSEDSIQIKNRVIEAALSDQWIESLTKKSRGSLVIASDHFSAHRYADADRHYDEYLRNQSAERNLTLVTRFEIAYSRFMVEKYATALPEFLKCLEQSEDTKAKSTFNYYIGVCLLHSERTSEAIQFFEAAANISDSPVKFRALAMLAEAKLRQRNTSTTQDALHVYEKIKAAPLVDEKAYREDQVAAKAFAALQLATLSLSRTGSSIAKVELESITNLVEAELPAAGPVLRLKIFEFDKNQETKKEQLLRVLESIKKNRLIPKKASKVPSLGLCTPHVLTIIDALNRIGLNAELDDFIEYLRSLSQGGARDPARLIYEMWDDVGTDSYASQHLGALRYAYERLLNSTDRLLGLIIARYLAYFSEGPDQEKYSLAYLNRFENFEGFTEFNPEDFVVLSEIASRAVRQRRDAFVRRVINAAKKAKEKVGNDAVLGWGYIIILVLSIDLYMRNNDSDSIRQAANEVLDLTSSEKSKALGEDAGPEFAEKMRVRASDALRQLAVAPYLRIARNAKVTVKYGEGSPIVKKFKLVKDDILAGRCSFIGMHKG